MKIRDGTRVLILLAPLVAACTGARTDTVSPSPIPGQPPPNQPPPPPSYVVTLVGAADIADCQWEGGSHAEATAKLVEKIGGAVFTAGDNAYFNATGADFNTCYAPRWGRFRGQTYPSPGNHEYQVSSTPYFDYFGDRAGPRGAGFYSYDLGNWHIISLNSNVNVGPGQEQYLWLQRDLEANKNANLGKCNLAYWHHPLFTSGPSAGSNATMRSMWSLLYEYGVDVVINGHDHLYERFAPQDVNGRRDTFGIQEYIVGTGGAPLYEFGPTLPNSVYKNNRVYGVLKLTLRDVGWDSVFIEAGTEATLDPSLNNLCH